MLKPKQLFIIIYVNFARNAFILTNNNNKQTITPCSLIEFAMIESPSIINCAVNKSKQFVILKI